MIITVSGNPGSGKGTISKYLARVFKLRYYSMGDMRRKMAESMDMNINELNKLGEKSFITDKAIDNFQKKLRRKNNIIVDGRLAFHFIPNSIKLYVNVDLHEGAKRIFKNYRKTEHYKNVNDAFNKLKKRIASDKKRYKKYYGIDSFNLKNYDIILDTTNKSITESKKMAREAIKRFING